MAGGPPVTRILVWEGAGREGGKDSVAGEGRRGARDANQRREGAKEGRKDEVFGRKEGREIAL